MSFPQLLLLADDVAPISASEVASTGTQVLTAAPPEGPSAWLVLLIFLGVVILPFALGNLIAKWLRVKDLSLKLGITFFALTLAVSPFINAIVRGEPLARCFRLGIDLAGGTNMVFQVDMERAIELEKVSAGQIIDPETMGRMVGAIRRRLNVSGVEEIVVRQVGDDRIEVIVPGKDPERVEQIINRIVDLGSLEISRLANMIEDQLVCEQGMAAYLEGSKDVKDASGRLIAQWRPVGADVNGQPKEIGTHYNTQRQDFDYRGRPWPHFLVMVETDRDREITGRLLTRAYETIDDQGLPAVGFQFNTEGGYLFQQLTAAHRPREAGNHRSRLAIVLSGEVHSAPSIETMISGGQGIIHGSFTSAEVKELIDVLNAGALEIPLIRKPISRYEISPMLGADVREKGVNAIIASSIAVFIFMLGYYLFAGIVANICLLMNVLLIMGVMSLIDATFTLPGLAGLVLTIGMAVDANVLIFERIREEINKGSSIRMSIHNGFSKAFSTIVDANITTLITAVVLYVIGTDQVKGFAVTLFIGIVMSMFTALYVGRMIFDICERNGWIKSLRMLGPSGNFQFRFLAYTAPAVTASVLLITAGILGMYVRKGENFDIDFRGGTMVTFAFEGDPPPLEAVQAAIAEQFETGATLEELVMEDGSKRYRLRTTDDDMDDVSQRINLAFENSATPLLRQRVTLLGEQVEPIPEGAAFSPAFEGGHQREVAVSTSIAAVTMQGALVDLLVALRDEDGSVRYSDASSLVLVDGVGQPEEGGGYSRFQVKLAGKVTVEDATSLFPTLKARFERDPIYEEINQFQAAVARDVMWAAIMAILFSLVAIIAYLWFRFQGYTFGVAAVVALVHDVLCVLGVTALCSLISGNAVASSLGLIDFKINLPIVAAILTIIGYSLNDTIVVFDRIREIRGRSPRLTVEMIDASLNQTLSRTILTGITTLIVVGILYVWGGEGIHGFAFSLVIGIIVGTFSSIYIASPVLLWLVNREYQRAEQKKMVATT